MTDTNIGANIGSITGINIGISNGTSVGTTGIGWMVASTLLLSQIKAF